MIMLLNPQFESENSKRPIVCFYKYYTGESGFPHRIAEHPMLKERFRLLLVLDYLTTGRWVLFPL